MHLLAEAGGGENWNTHTYLPLLDTPASLDVAHGVPLRTNSESVNFINAAWTDSVLSKYNQHGLFCPIHPSGRGPKNSRREWRTQGRGTRCVAVSLLQHDGGLLPEYAAALGIQNRIQNKSSPINISVPSNLSF